MTHSVLANPVLDRLRAGKAALGMSVRLSRSPDIVRIAESSGHDFIFIDVQHAVFNLETITNIASTALGSGIACIVRVRGINDPDVASLLDCGVMGIVFPDINTAQDAMKAVDLCRFAPIGSRSLTGAYPQFGYRSVPSAESINQLNTTCLVACMIESPEGMRNLDEIAAVPGFDVIHLGANDLLARMGKAGQFAGPDSIMAQDRVIAAARANGKYAGLGGDRDVAGQARSIRRGSQFLTTQSDIGLLMAGATQWTHGVRALLDGDPAG
jgi:staphyloferrin B biosynthesis citrate synthase